jgi:hypothetical protein
MDFALLRTQITTYFNKEELRNLCHDLNIKYENLPDETLEGKARELVEYCRRYGRESDLLQHCQKLRPHVNWDGDSEKRNTNLLLDDRFHLAEPRVPSHFRNREDEIRELKNLIANQKWCGVFGIGGTGKTVLVAHLAQTLRKTEGSQAIWFDLSENATVERILETLAQSVGHSLRIIPDPQQRYGYLRSITNGKNLLIIFDDVSDNKILDELLKAIGDQNAVLITGRNQGLKSIRKYGIETFLLNPLPDDEAVEVLLKLANISPPLSPSQMADWTSLAKSVGCLPLALEIIGGDLRFKSNRNPLEYLETHIETRKWLTNDEFIDRLQEALNENFNQLTSDHQRAFSCLGVFAGNGFDANAIQAVCSFDSNEAVEEFLILLRKRMLIRDNLGGTFSLHPVIRQYAQEKLIEQNLHSEHTDTPTGRYIAFYLQILRKYGGYEWNLDQYPKLLPYETEAINAVNTAFQLWQNSKNTDEETYLWLSVQMTVLISWYLFWRGYWDIRIQFCRRITDKLEFSGLLADPASRFSATAGNLYVDRGWIHLRRNEFDEATQCARRAETLLQFSGDLIFAIELSAQIHLKSGNSQQSYDLFLRLRNEQTENTRIWFVFSFRLADALVNLEKREEAISLLDGLLSKITDVRLHRHEIITDIHARIAFRLAKQLQKTGRSSRIQELLNNSVTLFNEAGIVDQTSVTAQIELAQYFLATKSRFVDAKKLLENALKQAQIIGDQNLAKVSRDLMNQWQT